MLADPIASELASVRRFSELTAVRRVNGWPLRTSSSGFSGRLRFEQVTSIKRLSILPEVPPIADFVPGYKTEGWYGLGAPAGTPTEVLNKLNEEVNAGLTNPQFSARLSEIGVEPFPSSPTEFRQFIIEFATKWGKIIRAAGIKLDWNSIYWKANTASGHKQKSR
jgi:hypothetical protein